MDEQVGTLNHAQAGVGKDAASRREVRVGDDGDPSQVRLLHPDEGGEPEPGANGPEHLVEVGGGVAPFRGGGSAGGRTDTRRDDLGGDLNCSVVQLVAHWRCPLSACCPVTSCRNGR